jgi:hypothetical protein
MIEDEIKKEIKGSIKRYFDKVWGWKVDDNRIKFPEDNVDLITNNGLRLNPTLIVGAELDFRLKDDYEDTEGYLKEISKWKFFYELFREHIGYVSCPFKPELMWIPKKDTGEPIYLCLEKINALWKKIRNFLKKNSEINKEANKFKTLNTFLQEAGKFFSAEDLIEKGVIGHATGDMARFLHQMANLLAGCILFLKENSEPKKVLLIDNNPKRKMIEIDTRFKEILTDDVRLNGIIEWMDGFIEIYYYTKEFRSLYQKLNKDDFSIIKDAIKEGADYYILKNQIFSLLYVYYTYLEEIGEIHE